MPLQGRATRVFISGASKAHGVATVGLSSVVLRASNLSRRSTIIQNLGPGIVYIGTSSVSTANTPKLVVDGAMTLDNSTDDIYAVADQAGTAVRFLEEIYA